MGQKNEPNRQPMPKQTKPDVPPPNMQEKDPIDEASDESFPASDPPSYTPVTHPGHPKRRS